MTNIIGLTGGIASGKTTISSFLRKKGFLIHDSDEVIDKLYSKPTENFLNYLKKINLSISITNKKIDKKKIREIIFNDTNKKKKLEKFLHKEVKKQRETFIKKNSKRKNNALILDIPLLFEAKLHNICDYIIFLYAPKNIRIKR